MSNQKHSLMEKFADKELLEDYKNTLAELERAYSFIKKEVDLPQYYEARLTDQLSEMIEETKAKIYTAGT